MGINHKYDAPQATPKVDADSDHTVTESGQEDEASVEENDLTKSRIFS
jgi:hypothetical protein